MANSDPPSLQVGTEVSAKYKGAFCEAKVRKVVRLVKCRVTFKESNVAVVIPDEFVKGPLKIGAEVEAKREEAGAFETAVINRLNDASTYTVVFDDGDVATLRRTQLCPKGDKHFMESETLDQLPLTHPEHFGTPVVQERDPNQDRKRRRSGRGNSALGSGDDSEDSSSDEETQLAKKRTPRTRRDAFVGKTLIIEVGDKRRTWYPGLAVLSSAHSTDLKKDQILVRSFKDAKFIGVSKKDVKQFTRETALKNEDKSLKAAIEKALLYIDNRELPANWDKEALLGSDSESEETGNESSDDEQTEEKDHFVAQLYKFMDDRGTPLNKGPSLGNRDLNLYKLFKLVQKYGGYNRVTSQMKWRLVYSKMNLPVVSTASYQIKQAYKKYLHAFEDFYRKLGSTMGTISRPGRGQGGRRSLLSFREKDATRSPKPERKMPGVTTPEEKVRNKDVDKDKEKEGVGEKMEDKSKPRGDDKVKAKSEEKLKEVKPEKSKEVKLEKAKEVRLEKSKEVRPEKSKDVRPEKSKEVKPEKPKEVKPEKSKEVKSEKLKEIKPEKLKEVKPKVKSEEKSKVQSEDIKDVQKPLKADSDGDGLKRKPSARLKKEEPPENEVPRRSRSRLDRVDVEKCESPRRPDSPRRGRPSKARLEEEQSKKGIESEDESSPKKEEESLKKLGRRRSSLRDGGHHSNDVKKSEKDKKVEKDESEESGDELSEPSKPMESSQKDVEPVYPPGVKVKIRYGRGRNQNIYEAKVMEAELENGTYQYWVHYAGWNIRYDEWVKKDRIVGPTDERDLVKRKREWKIENSKSNKEKSKEKDPPKDKDLPKDNNVVKDKDSVKDKDTLKDKESPKEKMKEEDNTVTKTTEKRRGRVAMVERSISHNASSPKSTASEPAIHKSKPATSVARPRPTRSNSVDIKLSTSLPVRVRRRSHRSSGFTESSDLASHVSDSEDSDHSDEESVHVEETQPYSDTSLEPPKLLASKVEDIEPKEDTDQDMPEINIGSDEKIEERDVAVTLESEKVAQEQKSQSCDAEKKEDGRRKRKMVDKGEAKTIKDEGKTKGKKQVEKVTEEDKQKRESDSEEKGRIVRRSDSFVSSKRRRISTDRESTPSKVKEEEEVKTVEDKLQAAIDEVAKSADKEDDLSGDRVVVEDVAERDNEGSKEEDAEKKKGNKKKAGRKKKEEDVSSDKESSKPSRSRAREESDTKKGKENDSTIVKVSLKREKTPEESVETSEMVEDKLEEAPKENDEQDKEKDVSTSQPSTSNAPDEPMEVNDDAENSPVKAQDQIATTSIVDNTPPTTPEGSPEPAEQIDELCGNEQEHAAIEEGVFLDDKTGLPASGGDSPNDVSTLSNGSGGSSGNAPSEDSNGDTQSTKVQEEVTEPPPKKKKKGHKRSGKSKNTPSKSHASDSDDASNHGSTLGSSCASSARVSPTKRHHSERTPRPSKYDFCSNLDFEDLEGEKRITILQDRIQDIRKIYMQLKSEVASIDRRRKRAKRKEREERANQSPSVEVEST